MAENTVKLQIPLESLVASIAALSLKEKLKLWEFLNEQLAQSEEMAWEKDSTLQAEIQEARAAYEAGDYITIDEYAQSLETDE